MTNAIMLGKKEAQNNDSDQQHIAVHKFWQSVSFNGAFRPYVPQPLRYSVFVSIHGVSHASSRVTNQQIHRKYVWPFMRMVVTSWADNPVNERRTIAIIK